LKLKATETTGINVKSDEQQAFISRKLLIKNDLDQQFAIHLLISPSLLDTSDKLTLTIGT
jgi:hypothetical protein